VPVGCDGGHCLLASLLVFQLSQNFSGLEETSKHFHLAFVPMSLWLHFIPKRVNQQIAAHLPPSGVGLHHSGGPLDLLVLLLLLSHGKTDILLTKVLLCVYVALSFECN